MAKQPALVALLPLLLLSSFLTVFAQHPHTIAPSSPHTPQPAPSPHHHHHHRRHPYPHPLSPTSAPLHSPAYPPHHHHHHHSPAPAPVIHHHLTPTHTPTPAPLHPHYTPTPAPAPAHAPLHPPPPHSPHYPPVHSPVPVTHPPVSPPPVVVHPPVPRSFVAVQGVVYVKSCKYSAVDTLLGALPLLDGVVKLQCNNTRYKLVQTAKTDKNGYFFLEAPKSITTFGAHKCNVVLVSAPNGLKPSNLHGGVTGAFLRPQKPYVSDSKLPFFLYSVGPLAFQPNCPK